MWSLRSSKSRICKLCAKFVPLMGKVCGEQVEFANGVAVVGEVLVEAFGLPCSAGCVFLRELLLAHECVHGCRYLCSELLEGRLLVRKWW